LKDNNESFGAEQDMRCTAVCWVGFPSKVAYASANYGHCCTFLFLYFLLYCCFCESARGQIKS